MTTCLPLREQAQYQATPATPSAAVQSSVCCKFQYSKRNLRVRNERFLRTKNAQVSDFGTGDKDSCSLGTGTQSAALRKDIPLGGTKEGRFTVKPLGRPCSQPAQRSCNARLAGPFRLAGLGTAQLWTAKLAAVLCAVIGSAGHAAPPASAPPRLCLTGGQVVDPERKTITRADIVIEGERIARVGPGAGASCAGRIVDVSGKFVMPGLIDLHVHLEGNPSPTDRAAEDPGIEATTQLVMRTGLLDMLDLAGDPSILAPLRDKLRASNRHANLHFAAPVFLNGRLQSEREVREQVQRQAAWRPDFIKIIPFEEPAFAAAIAESTRLGLRTIVHINTWEEARVAVEAGATAITHLQDEVVIPDDLVRLMAARGTRLVPTIAMQCDLARYSKTPALLEDPLLKQVTTPALRQQYREQQQFTEKARRWVKWQQDDCVAKDFVSLRKLRDAHLTILAGSDTGNLGTFQGYSTHRELELLAEAGIPPWDALQAGTTKAAEFLGVPWGVSAGRPANLLVLDASPVDDVRNTRRIAKVIYRGVVSFSCAP